MFKVHLNKMKFFAHHGLHDEEGITGTEFEVSAEISFKADEVHSIHDTINYVTVFEIVKKAFKQPERLLENLAQDITEQIHNIDARITTINITIDKLNPPIYNFTGSVGISYFKSYL
jgi:dihydroneopterin aldolase